MNGKLHLKRHVKDFKFRSLFRLFCLNAPHRVAGQGNVPTVLHWGSAAAVLTPRDLRGYDFGTLSNQSLRLLYTIYL